MFMPASAPKSLETDTLSRVEAPPPPRLDRLAPGRHGSLRRIAKLVVAGSVVAAGLIAGTGELVGVRSTDAIVSAPLVPIRAPIAGIVAQGAPPPGTFLRRGALVLRIVNPRLSRLKLDELRAHEAELRAGLAALARRRDALLSLQADLRQRADAQASLTASQLDAEIAGAGASLAASTLRQAQARRDLARRQILAASGDLALAEVERAQTAVFAMQHEQITQAAALRGLRIRRAAAAQADGASLGGASYASQRLDEVTITLIELDQNAATMSAALAQTAALATATERDFALHAEASLPAPADAIVWRHGAQAGDRVAEGDAVAELVACGQAVIVAAVSQKDLPSIMLDGRASIRLSGEYRDRKGFVIGTVAQAAVAGDARLATLPDFGKRAGAIVLVSLDSPADETDSYRAAGQACLVGRAARVRLPRAHAGLLESLAESLF
jgi:multidrug resistance efflux pump